jgi:tetratricopeptide (TPR) repeat protein
MTEGAEVMPAADLDSLFQKARAASRERDYTAAADLYRQALALEAASIEALEGLGMVLFAAGELAAAAEPFQRLTQLQPLEARHYVNLGAIYNRDGQHQQAIDVLRKAIQRDRKCADAYYNLGVAQRKLNQSSMAVSAYKEAIRLDPQLVEAYQNLGNVYLEMGSPQLAMTNFRKALEIRPDFERARVGLEKAEDAFQRAKELKNPFGKLVNTAAIAPKAVPTLTRELTESERKYDRQRVRQLATELKTLVDECLTHLRSKIEPGIQALQRTVAEGNFKSLSFVGAATEFQEALRQWMAMRQQIKRKTLELRAHEELVNTPDMLPHE